METAVSTIDQLTLVVVNKLKSQTNTFNSRGGKLVSAVDSRVGIQVPKTAFRFSADVTLKVRYIIRYGIS